LLGGVGNDTLIGNGGDDILRGGLDADHLSGGADNDTYQIAGTEGIGDTINDTSGTDTLQLVGNATLTGFNAAGLSIERLDSGGFELKGTSAANNFSFSGATGIGLSRIDGGAGNDTIRGTLTNDSLMGGAGRDKLFGGNGNDVLTGGIGRDILTGGANKDRFDFNAVAESRAGVERDQITDFRRGQKDKIDLAGIDANTKLGGNQAFKFIGAAAFNKVAGELRFQNQIVQADVNGDGKADFEIRVNVAVLVKGDFVL
jgi:serralysin